MNARGSGREVEGVVILIKMAKTVVVSVSRRVLHPLYKKYMTQSRKYYAHDEKQEASVGDTIRIVESKPLSKLKRWRLKKIIKKAVQ